MAGSAPGRPEVHHQRELAAPQLEVETLGVPFQWRARKQPRVTAPADGILIQTRGWQAVYPAAVGADYMQC